VVFVKRVVLFGLLAIAGGFLGALIMRNTVAGQGTVVMGSGVAQKFDATSVTAVEVCTRSVEFVDLPEMSQTFRMEGDGSGALTLFQARWFNNTGEPARIRIRHLVDTVSIPDEDAVMWTLQSGALAGIPGIISGSSGMNFFDLLPSGPHVVTIQWRSQFGQEICTTKRTLIVLHR
jgi:hypothetical protein